MSELVHRLAEKAGIAKEGFTEKMESIGGRGYVANLAELSEFAKLVGQVARADERRKYERPDDTPSTENG